MTVSSINNAEVYTDFSGLAELRHDASKDPGAALRTVAQQFEALFMQMMLKSMRDAGFEDPLFGGNDSKLYRDMYDQQIAVNLSRQGSLGLADMMVQQLGSQFPADVSPVTTNMTTGTLSGTGIDKTHLFKSPDEFVETLRPMAEKAAGELGTKAEVLLAQAALETGWGKHVLQHSGGRSSHNLFNIKADNRWQAERVNVNTLEYEGDVAVRRQAAFRSYDSFADSFSDYVDFLKSNPRYREALNHAADPQRFVQSLQSAGYATDPAYADKIQRILGENMPGAIKLSTDGTLS